MLDQIASLAAFAAMALAAYGLGRPIIRGLGVGQEDGLSTAVWSLGVGLIAAGVLLAGLGLAGALYAWLIGVLTMTACFWAVGEMLLAFERQRETDLGRLTVPPGRPDESLQAPWSPPGRWLSQSVLLLACLACLGSLICALAPPTAGDAMCYHLELPKTFLAQHSLTCLPYDDNATFPLMAEMWYLWGLALDGGVAAQLVHWGLGVLLALATVVLATPIVGRPWARVAGAVVLLVPGINNQMTAPLNDVALAVCTTLAAAAWWRAVVDQGSRRWFVLAGLAAGGALGTKITAGMFVLAVAATWGWGLLRRPQQRRLLVQGAAIVGVVALSVGGFWYVRAAWHRGNPVYPLASELFHSAGAPAGRDQTLPAEKSPLGRSPLGLAAAPWQLTMQPERFGGRGHRLGVLLLAVLPGLLLARRLRGLGTLLAMAAAYFVAWYLLRQNVRFLFPIVPLLAVAVAWVWIESRRFPPLARLAAGGAFAVILAASAVVAAARCHDRLAVALGLESREHFLASHEPTYPAAAVADGLLGEDACILSQDCRAFYFKRPVIRESIYRRLTHYDRQIAGPAELSRFLREAGFTHLLLAENVAGRGVRYDPTLSRLADAPPAAARDDSLLELTQYWFRDGDGALRHYRLVKLQ